MKSIIITGGNGYIGSAICLKLYKQNFNPVILDRSKKLYLKKLRIPFFKFDITKIDKIFKEYDCDTIIHCASTNSDITNKKKIKNYYKQNVFDLKTMLEKCSNYKIKNFILISSCSVYGNSDKKLKENSQKIPMSHYGIVKLIDENLIRSFAKKYNFKYAILRLFNVTGSITHKNISIGPKLKSKAILSQFFFKKNMIGIKKNPKNKNCLFPKRDYVHVQDVSDTIFSIVKYLRNKKKNIILNIGSGKDGIDLPHLIKTYNNISENKIRYKIHNKVEPLNYIVADIEKAKKFINYRAKYSSIQNILQSLMKWFNEKK